MTTSRTESAVCMTFVATRPANSLPKKPIDWPSICRCMRQRALIGTLPIRP